MKKLNKGFTVIELLIVIAIIGILATTLAPKLLKEIRKATVAEVQHNLGVIRSRLSLDDTLSEEFPDFFTVEDVDKTDLLKSYSIEPTPSFTDADGVNHKETSQVVTPRDNTGGWFYIKETGEIYANLPNGAYTKDKEYEIWDDEDSKDNNGGEEVEKPTDPVGGDWDKFIEGAIKENTLDSKTGITYVSITFNQGPNGNTITPSEKHYEAFPTPWEKTYLYDVDHNLIPNPNSEDGSYNYQEVIDVSTSGSNNSTDYIVVLEKTDPDTGKKTHLYSNPK